MLSAQIRCVVGIDVAKQFHVVCALEAPSGIVRQRARRIEATSEGYTQLGQWLQAWGDPEALLIGLEATGTLWEPLYDWLIQTGYQVLVLNPRQTSSWAASLGLRAKTDGIDAHTLARGLLAGYARASTRAVGARSLVVRALALHLLDLRARLAELEAAIAALVGEDEEAGRLQEIPGIGPQNAATLRAELGDVSRFSRVEQVIAYVGLEPRTQERGRFIGQKRLSKRGPGALRHALYLAALVAARYRTEWRERYQRLLARGRAKKEALTILSRSLLKVVYHLLRTGTSYDPACLTLRRDRA